MLFVELCQKGGARLHGGKVPQNSVDSGAQSRQNLPIPPMKPLAAHCKHPQVRVVARDEDAEFVECQLCGEVFDAIEYRDMILEEEESLLRENESA
jgi:hypothetical protein